jgi:ribosomal protein S27AE
MEETTMKCPQCGAIMTQKGSENQKVRYHCSCCGKTTYVAMSVNENDTYWELRSELLARVRSGLFDWKTTNWLALRRDIHDFIGRYAEARDDIYLKMSIVACITDGFHDMNSEEYKEAKAIFRVTEKVYKNALKRQKLDPTVPFDENYLQYEEYRTLYKQCRNEYRNHKIYWKIIFFLCKNLVRF